MIPMNRTPFECFQKPRASQELEIFLQKVFCHLFLVANNIILAFVFDTYNVFPISPNPQQEEKIGENEFRVRKDKGVITHIFMEKDGKSEKE